MIYRKTNMRTHLLACSFVTLSLLSAGALAQARAPGFSVDRFEPAERGSDWFALESLDFREHGRLGIGVIFDYANRPLVVYDASGDEELAALVEHQLFGHLGGTLALWERVRFGVNLPIALAQAGDGVVASGTDFSSDNATTLGDLRLGADLRLLGHYGDVATVALGARVFVPTGSRDSFTGDGTARFSPRLALAGASGEFVYASHVAMNVRPQDDGFGGSPTGNELAFGAAAGLRIGKNLVVGPELSGTTVVQDGAAFKQQATPLEVLVGGHYRINASWRAGLGVGPGLTRGYGSPALRGLAMLEYFPAIQERAALPPSPPDSDADGIFDGDDACPQEPGVRTDDAATNGCPPKKDTDRDGIFDMDDACPTVAGVRTDHTATNGCPPKVDTDRDGVFDGDDACPHEPGPRTDDPKNNGCPPPPDRDRDGIPNERDACPDAAGPPSEDSKKHGCPLVRIEKGQIKIVEQVKFAYNSEKILPDSEPILNAVLRILEENQDITKVEVHGHTDSKGGDGYNKALSRRRAASVVRWLTVHGVEKDRLASDGFGEEKPIDSNDTEEGRRNNRRVEFHIVGQRTK